MSSDKSIKCHYQEGTIPCAFMPTSLDSRSHAKLRLKQSKVAASGEVTTLSANHPQNSHIKVEGTKFQPKKSQYAIGVFEEGSSDMMVFPASSYSVQVLVKEALIRDDEVESRDQASYLEKRKDLINTYAPVKKQRQLRAAVNAIVSDEKIEGFQESIEVMREALNDSLEAKEASSSNNTTPEESQTKGILGQMRELLPPFDLKATTPDTIYNFGALFPESLISSLDTSGSACEAIYKWISDDFRDITDEEAMLKDVSKLGTMTQIGRIFLGSKHEKKKNFAKLLNILISMISLYKIKRKRGWSAWDIYATDALAERLGELYSSDKTIGGNIDREGANKLLSHICLFTLRLTPYWEFDFSDIKADLNCQAKEILAILSFSGIVVKSTANRSGLIGSLKAPLVVQTIQAPKRKSGGGR